MGKPAGKVMPRPRGPYDPDAVYDIIDMVTLDNKLWVAMKSGVTGITPSKTAAEWMMAVDGTTDVKQLESEVDTKFEEIDTKFGSVDTRFSSVDSQISAVNSSITDLQNTVSGINTTADKNPTKNSTNLVQSGGVYDCFHRNYDQYNYGGNSDYWDLQQNHMTVSYQYIDIYSETSQNRTDSNGFIHKTTNAHMRVRDGKIYLSSNHEKLSGDTNSDSVTGDSQITVGPGDILFWMERLTSDGYTMSNFLKMEYDCFGPVNYDNLDLGKSGRPFNDIYAKNSSIITSDAKRKKDVESLDPGLTKELVMGLNPVSFKFIHGTSGRTHYGFIAQEVEETVQNLEIGGDNFAPLIKTQAIDDDGNLIEGEYDYGLRYEEFVGILTKMCQNLQNEVNTLKEEVASLKSVINA